MKKRSDINTIEGVKLKERHIVVWTQEEDDILREQIRIYGTDNWAIVASKFSDKTTRQCRRRWYTYLNSDFKKGGWTPEEDMLLCEAQRKFGNKWTEIAKMVSGRTDNAVKNRFSTLCKKRAKREALAKEDNIALSNVGKKRILLKSEVGVQENEAPYKKMRTHIPVPAESCNREKVVPGEYEKSVQNQLRPPLAALVKNSVNVGNLLNRRHIPIPKESIHDGHNYYDEDSSLAKDDTEGAALMRQAESFTSLAVRASAQNTEHSLEHAWKVLRELLSQTKDGDLLRCNISDVNFQLEEFKNLLQDFKNREEGMRQPDLYEESSGSSDYSTGSTLLSHATEGTPINQPMDTSELNQDMGSEIQVTPGQKENEESMTMFGSLSYQADGFQSSQEPNGEEVVSAESAVEFGSPLHVTPLFPDESTEIPSPKFSESERNFLIKALGMEAPYHPGTNLSQPHPICKRALLHSL
uniref:Uncharacterized protein n=1 Tax=Kalanchoe fedtschenkoi TaxID=63787 RepID=A0A7N1A331_KALFE